MAKLFIEDGKYYLDQENGTEVVECKILTETTKKSDKHPEGMQHIVLPKDNITNRQFVSIDKFNAEAVDGVMTVEIKTGEPRKLGATGVKQSVIAYLDEADAAEYTNLVNAAVEKYKATKTTKHKKPEEMNIEELEAYINALKSGTKLSIKEGPKSFIDCFTDDEYARYNELLAKSVENKANRPKPVRGPLTDEQKLARKQKSIASQISKAEARLAQLRAGFGTADEDIIDEDIDEDI